MCVGGYYLDTFSLYSQKNEYLWVVRYISPTIYVFKIDYQYGKEMVFSLGWMDDSKTIVYTMPSQEQRVEAYQISFPRTWSQLFLDFLLFVFVILLLIALFPETFLSLIQYMERMSASPFAKEEL